MRVHCTNVSLILHLRWSFTSCFILRCFSATSSWCCLSESGKQQQLTSHCTRTEQGFREHTMNWLHDTHIDTVCTRRWIRMNVYALNTEVITRKGKEVSNSSLRTGFYLAYIRPDALAFLRAKHRQGTVKPVHKPSKGMHLHFLHTCIYVK